MALCVVSGSDVTYVYTTKRTPERRSTYWSRSIHLVVPKGHRFRLAVAHEKEARTNSVVQGELVGFCFPATRTVLKTIRTQDTGTQYRYSIQWKTIKKITSKTKEDLNKRKKNKRFEYVVSISNFRRHRFNVDYEPHLDLTFFTPTLNTLNHFDSTLLASLSKNSHFGDDNDDSGRWWLDEESRHELRRVIVAIWMKWFRID